MFFEFDVWIKSTISIIQGIKKKILFNKRGGRGPLGPPLNPPLVSDRLGSISIIIIIARGDPDNHMETSFKRMMS